MKQNAKSDKPFTFNSYILERVRAWENLISNEIRVLLNKGLN